MPKNNSKRHKDLKPVAIFAAGLLMIGLIAYGVVSAIIAGSIPDFVDGNETSIVKLTTTDGVADEWSCKINDEAIAEVINKSSKARGDANKTIDLLYEFKGKKPGRTVVTFKYGSFAEGNTKEQYTYLVEVNKDLKIKITEQ